MEEPGAAKTELDSDTEEEDELSATELESEDSL